MPNEHIPLRTSVDNVSQHLRNIYRIIEQPSPKTIDRLLSFAADLWTDENPFGSSIHRMERSDMKDLFRIDRAELAKDIHTSLLRALSQDMVPIAHIRDLVTACTEVVRRQRGTAATHAPASRFHSYIQHLPAPAQTDLQQAVFASSVRILEQRERAQDTGQEPTLPPPHYNRQNIMYVRAF